MSHPTDDELIQHFCGEGDTATRARLDAHVAVCADCRVGWEEITHALTMVDTAVPEPPDGFERVIWARVQQTIAQPQPGAWRTWRQLLPAGALAAAAIIGVALAGVDGGPRTPADTTTAGVNDLRGDNLRQSERVLYTAMDEHLEQTQALLVELQNAPDRDNLGLERITADDLVAAGRLYRQMAEYTGHDSLVRMLDDLEPVLVELARGPERIDQRDRQWLRARIDSDNLLFKVRAVSNDVRERAGHPDQ